MKEFFENFAPEEKKSIDYKLPLREILTRSKKTFSFLENHGYLYDFLATVLENTSLNNIRSLQVKFLNDLMNRFNIYKKIKGANKASGLYLYLLVNLRRTVYDVFLNTPTDKYNKEMYLQAQKLLSLWQDIFKKLTNKRILNNNSGQSSIAEEKYKESIAKTKNKIRTRIKTKI